MKILPAITSYIIIPPMKYKINVPSHEHQIFHDELEKKKEKNKITILRLILKSISTGLCTTTDIDWLLYHMNNARYLRELDFARADFYERTNLYREICSQGSGVVQGASTIRYRRFLKPLSIFKITSKVSLVYRFDHLLSVQWNFSVCR